MIDPIKNPESIQTTTAQNSARLVLGLLLVTAGISHLSFARETFQVQVPDWVPLDKDLTVVLSGYVEIVVGLALLLVRKYRIALGLFTGIFFILVFPGNISQYVNHRNGFGLNTDFLRGLRLGFQPVLVSWAWWSSGAWTWLRRRASR